MWDNGWLHKQLAKISEGSSITMAEQKSDMLNDFGTKEYQSIGVRFRCVRNIDALGVLFL